MAASNANRQYLRLVVASPEYQAGLVERWKVERKSAEAKSWHGFGRSCYRVYGITDNSSNGQ